MLASHEYGACMRYALRCPHKAGCRVLLLLGAGSWCLASLAVAWRSLRGVRQRAKPLFYHVNPFFESSIDPNASTKQPTQYLRRARPRV